LTAIVVLMVADGARLSLGCVVAAIIARKAFSEARFHFVVPDGVTFDLGSAGWISGGAGGLSCCPSHPGRCK
jgi:hypothetical protein